LLPYLYLEALRHFAKRVQKYLAVRIFDEDRLPMVAPGTTRGKGHPRTPSAMRVPSALSINNRLVS